MNIFIPVRNLVNYRRSAETVALPTIYPVMKCENQVNCIKHGDGVETVNFFKTKHYVKKIIDCKVSFKEAKNMVEKPTKT